MAQLLSRLTYNIELVAEAATNAVTLLIRDTLTIAGAEESVREAAILFGSLE